jgi:hypothetical protein
MHDGASCQGSPFVFSMTWEAAMSNDCTPGGVREVLAVYRYEIEPRPAALGGGVRLYLYGPDQETGEEIELGGGVFPSGPEEAEITRSRTPPLRDEPRSIPRIPAMRSSSFSRAS